MTRQPLPLHAYWVVPGRLAAGARPSGGLDAFDLVVDLTEGGDAGSAAGRFHGPIADFGSPSPELVVDILDAIDAELTAGHVVYVHCDAGLGRTGTIIGCWLARHGTTGEAAIARIEALRGAAALPPARTPETVAQRELVIGWRVGR